MNLSKWVVGTVIILLSFSVFGLVSMSAYTLWEWSQLPNSIEQTLKATDTQSGQAERGKQYRSATNTLSTHPTSAEIFTIIITSFGLSLTFASLVPYFVAVFRVESVSSNIVNKYVKEAQSKIDESTESLNLKSSSVEAHTSRMTAQSLYDFSTLSKEVSDQYDTFSIYDYWAIGWASKSLFIYSTIIEEKPKYDKFIESNMLIIKKSITRILSAAENETPPKKVRTYSFVNDGTVHLISNISYSIELDDPTYNKATRTVKDMIQMKAILNSSKYKRLDFKNINLADFLDTIEYFSKLMTLTIIVRNDIKSSLFTGISNNTYKFLYDFRHFVSNKEMPSPLFDRLKLLEIKIGTLSRRPSSTRSEFRKTMSDIDPKYLYDSLNFFTKSG